MSRNREKLLESNDRFQRDKEALAKVLSEQKVQEQGQTLSVLDALRKTRKQRGGVGEPLIIPRSLQLSSNIIVTDAELNDGFDRSNSESE